MPIIFAINRLFRSALITAAFGITAQSGSVAQSTRDLFPFQRDDKALDHVTFVRVNAAHTASAPISPLIFGNFLEHLGGAVYEGVWAQIILNPNLEKIEDGEKAPPHWDMAGSAVWQADGYLSPLCVRLSPSAGASAAGSVSQTVFLPTHRESKYIGYLFVRAPQGVGQVQITFTSDSGKTLVQTTLSAEQTGWRRLAFPFTLAAGALSKGEAARLTVTQASGNPVDVDQIELYPQDNNLGFDKDVLKAADALHPPVLRWPGGNFASGYHWKDGLGRAERRPTRRNPAWGGVEPNAFGITEFIRFCRLLLAKPQITVNAGDGTPEEAADWVHFCNTVPGKNHNGFLRASNGSPEPYDVDLWEIGNELYGDWQIGHTDPKGNADRFVRFRDAMRQADPDIALIATGKGDEFTPEGRQRNAVWNETLLRTATANNGDPPNYLSLHPLVPLPADLGKATYAEQYESAMAHPTFFSSTMIPEIAALITKVEGPAAKTRLALTEWGIIVGGETWLRSPNHDSMAGAVFNALTLNAMIRCSDWVTLANMTALMHGGGIKKPRGVVIVDPQYWTQQLYTLAHPQTPVETLVTGPGQDVPARGYLPAVVNVPDVDVVAALTKDAKSLVVFAVNRHRTESRPLRLNVEGFAASTLTATILTAPSPQARNSIEKPDAVAPRPFPAPPWPAQNGAWQTTIPPHSLVVFTLKR